MQGTATPSSKFSPEREYSRRWYKKTTVKKLYKKVEKKRRIFPHLDLHMQHQHRDLLSQNPHSTNYQQQKRRILGERREREIENATEERVVTRKEAKLEMWMWNMPLDLADTLSVKCEV